MFEFNTHYYIENMMIKVMKFKLLILFNLLFLLSCIEEYKIPNSMKNSYKSYLVVEGRILSGDESIIYLSQTKPLNTVERPEAVLNAKITIIGQNGYESSLATFDNKNERYTIPTHELELNTLYAIKIEYDGEVYQSDFQSIQTSKEIDEINYKADENEMTIYISSHGTKDESNFYMWTFEEDWEFHTEIDMTEPIYGYWMYNKKFYPDIVIGGENPYYYCWGHNNSSTIHIYSSLNLEQNAALEYRLHQIPLDDVRVSYIYSILVKQSSLDEKAYEYFRRQKLYSEESGGLFTPMPSELMGNIRCISNPLIKVYGYVIASQTVSKRIFIYESDLTQKTLYNNCSTAFGIDETENESIWKSNWEYETRYGAVIWNSTEGVIEPTSILYSRTCVDCRAFPGATKKRPDFWPNNHE